MLDALAQWLLTPIGAACKRHVEGGFKIFPVHGVRDDLSCTCGNPDCGNIGKHPFSRHGLLDASHDLKKVAQTFNYRSDLNIGAATGESSKILVIDVDQNKGGDEAIYKVQEVFGILPPTMRLLTGNGYHLVYNMPPGERIKSRVNVFGADYKGVDVRASGGYIVIFPSRHASGKMYQYDPKSAEETSDLPRLYIDYLRGEKLREKREVDRNHTSGNVSEWTIDDAADMLRFIDPDMAYDDWIAVGMALHKEGFPLDLWDKWSAKGAKYAGIRDLNSHWKSFDRNGDRTMGTLVEWAKLQGWKPKSHRAGRLADEAAIAAVAPFVERLQAKAAAAKRPKNSMGPPEEEGEHDWIRPLEVPGPLGDTVRWITKYAIYEQPMLALLNVLSFAGAVFGRKYCSPINTRTNLYMVGVARTGGGKEHSVRMIETLSLNADLMSFIGSNSIRSDVGILKSLIANSSQIFHLDEFGMLLQGLSDNHAPSHKQAIIKMLTMLYSKSSGVYDHGERADSKGSPLVVNYPNLCIYGTSTEESYAKALRRSAIQSGELNRFIVIPSRDKPLPRRDTPLAEQDPALVEWWEGFSPKNQPTTPAMANCARMSPKPIVVGWGECEELQYRINCEQADKCNSPDPMRDLWSRMYENTIKIAMIFAIARNPEAPEMSKLDFDYAYSIVRTSIDYMVSLARYSMSETPHEVACNEILKIIRARPKNGLSRSEIARNFRKYNKKQIDDALSSLLEEGAIVADKSMGGIGMGRPSVVYRVP